MANDLDRVRRLESEGEARIGTSIVKPLLSHSHGAGIAMGVSEFEPGSTVSEVAANETIFVLEGELEIVSGTDVYHLAEGDCLWMPRGSAVTYRTTAPCRIVYTLILAS